MKKVKWFVAGDVDGFFGLMVDNLIQILVLIQLCKFVCGFPEEFIYGTILPGAAFSLIVGNFYYSWQAYKLSQKEGREDVTALPYGINTVSLFTFIFFVMFPVYQKTGNYKTAWQVGLMACFLSGLIEFFGSFVADWIRRVTPRAALLSALAGIAITFISMDFLIRTYNNPLVAFIPLAVILAQYFGKLKFPFRIPAGLVAVILGTIVAWLSGFWTTPMMSKEILSNSINHIGFYYPIFTLSDILSGLTWENIKEYTSFILPMGVMNVVGSLQNIESAEAAGDKFETRESLAVNGIGTILGSFFGSPFPTTIYIGHPGWKGMGARVGYSIWNGSFMTIMCTFGLMGVLAALVPIEAGMPILLWIGIIIGAQAFETTPKFHAPAIIFGLFPAIAGWGMLLVQSAFRYGQGQLTSILQKVNIDNPPSILLSSVPSGALPFQLHGLISLSQGFLLTSMIWAALTVAILEKRFHITAYWCLVGAGLSAVGLIHSYQLMENEILGNYNFPASKEFFIAYVLLSIFFWITNKFTKPIIHKHK
jgi:AGZA family xanthine/uracil permease-like MFS transporter